MISYLFNLLFYQPLLNGLIFLYDVVPNHDMGLSIIVLTVLIRLILWPLTKKGIKNQAAMAKLQPAIDETRKKYKNDKEAQAKALMELYSKNKINPLAGFVPLLFQIPIIIALWRVFLNSAELDVGSLYSFIGRPEAVQTVFLGLFDLTKRSVLLAIVAGALQYWQTKMIMPEPKAATGGAPDFGRIMSRQMLYFGPLITITISWSLPAALPLYWATTTALTLLQQYLTQKNGQTGTEFKPN